MSNEKVLLINFILFFVVIKNHIILQVDYTNANKACCAMGMTLAIFETTAEQTCIADYTRSEQF